ncbi:unnamed protein product [Trifolium pratense]|uniref:Uncharacterized protein n=1 Tax=Trifolium pratense TaxID=57577 RepID=A0ACB0M3R0_TRIPR|nr:unnamed protein product [Trifolium pratense]
MNERLQAAAPLHNHNESIQFTNITHIALYHVAVADSTGRKIFRARIRGSKHSDALGSSFAMKAMAIAQDGSVYKPHSWIVYLKPN